MENNADLRGVAGYHHVNKNEARDFIQPYLGQDGYYLLRPSDQDGIVCTICVVNKMKPVNYRVSEDKQTGQYFILNNKFFPSIQELVHYYALNPINAEAMTLLLNPIMAEENYVVMEKEDVVVQKNGNKPHKGSVSKQQRPVATSGKGTTKGDVDSSLVGLHKHLPKSHLSAVMEPYLGEDGHYLLRPSSTSKDQLTLTVSHLGKHSNFKINYENGQYFINTKKKFDSMKQLLECYHNAPIKSKQKDTEIYLLFPIPADEELELQFEKEAEAMKVTKSEVVEDPLPEPWQQFYNEEYRRHYYHNPITNSTVWERPRVSSGREKRRCATLPTKRRGLPQVPDDETAPSAAPPTSSKRSSKEDKQGNGSARASTKDRSLLSVPYKENDRPLTPLPAATSGNKKDRGELPASSSRDDLRGPLPPLPGKEGGVNKSLPSLPAKGEAAPRPLPSLPPKDDAPPPHSKTANIREEGKPLPPLPPKGDEPLIVRSHSTKVPPLPQKLDESGASNLLSVPRSDSMDMSPKLSKRLGSSNKQTPPPSKSSSSPPVPASEPSSPRQAGSAPTLAPQTAPPPAPPLPPVANPTLGVAPPPPPPIGLVPPPPSPIGLAPPPPPPPPIGLVPPPPSLPPLLSPNVNAHRLNNAPSSPDPSSGRPFNAGDLATGKDRLKKSDNPPGGDPKKSLSFSLGKGGMADIISTALDTRRKVMADSDSEESEFEDVDEEWDD